jgi:hypothetical protein
VKTGIATLCATLACLALTAPGAQALSLSVWNGTNPYQCTIQDAGTGTAVPDPGADPYCVRYDKTGQSLLPSLGIITFLRQEPERIAIALKKCFYYQEDHWTGAIVQGHPSTQLWNWVGHYYLDFATGSAGAYFQDFYLGPPGKMQPVTFGLQLKGFLPVNPACAARAKQEPWIYANGT